MDPFWTEAMISSHTKSVLGHKRKKSRSTGNSCISINCSEMWESELHVLFPLR